ncbi:hypothetical protein LTR13_010554 [Exophiala sideris]|nr:hypothetical protein LTR13_010554 [Exophiala sideris]
MSSAGIEDVAGVVEKAKPDVLFCASMWTKEESDQILQIARGIVPKLKTYVVPRGMQVAIGPDATVDHVISKLDGIIHQDV